MSTLSNVETLGGGELTSRIFTKHDADPQAMNTHLGVSVDYAHDPNRSWFVLRATYGRERQAYDYLSSQGIDVYLPMRHVVRHINGQSRRITQPLLPNILFAYATSDQVRAWVKHTPALSYLRVYYNRLVVAADGSNPPLTIPCREMDNFIRATGTDSDHLRLIDPARCHYRIGDPVRVIDGAFRGVEGRVARIAGQQRVVVTLDGLCTVATAYIPTAFLESIVLAPIS